MTSFQHSTPAFRTYWGDDALAELPGELARAGARRVVLMCGASLAREGRAVARVQAALGERCIERFESVREHSPVPDVLEAMRVLERTGADGVVAVGGGSAVVTARAASILLAERRDVRELCTQRRPDGRWVSPRLDAPKLPQWVVATTPTTAYAKAGSAVRDPVTGDRLALFDPKTRARALFIDPVLTATAPVGLVEAASLNALSMAVGGLEGDAGDPLAEALLRQSLVLLADALPRLRQQPDDAGLRASLMLAALLSGQGTDYTQGGVNGVLGHSVAPCLGVPMGVANAMLLAPTMRFNAPVTGARLARVAHALGDARAAAEADPLRAVAAVEALLARLPGPHRLRDTGVAPEALDGVVEHAMHDWFLQRNPRPVTREDLEALLRAAW
jgi:alcohol dehydrogenase class IV